MKPVAATAKWFRIGERVRYADADLEGVVESVELDGPYRGWCCVRFEEPLGVIAMSPSALDLVDSRRGPSARAGYRDAAMVVDE